MNSEFDKELHTSGFYVSAKGYFEFDDFTVPYIAISVVSKIADNKLTIDNFISTKMYDDPVKIINIAISNNVIKSGKYVTIQKPVYGDNCIPKDYNLKAGYIDQINEQLMSYPKFRMHRWKVKHFLTFFYGMINNGNKFNSLYNKCHCRPIEWKKKTANWLSPRVEISPNHELLTLPNHICGNQSRIRCSACYHCNDKKDTRTTRYCVTCQAPMCKSCHNNSKNNKFHLQFATSQPGFKSQFKAKFNYINQQQQQQHPQQQHHQHT